MKRRLMVRMGRTGRGDDEEDENDDGEEDSELPAPRPEILVSHLEV